MQHYERWGLSILRAKCLRDGGRSQVKRNRTIILMHELFRSATVRPATSFPPGTPLRESEHPIRHRAAGGAVSLDKLFRIKCWQLAFVNQERPALTTAFALEYIDIGGHWFHLTVRSSIAASTQPEQPQMLGRH